MLAFQLRYGKLLVKGEQFGIALSVEEQFVCLLLKAESKIFELLQSDFLVAFVENFRDNRNLIKCRDAPV